MTISNEFEKSKYQQIEKLLRDCQTINNFKQRELIINQIVAIILKSRPLCRRFNGAYLQGIYREIYDLVKEELLSYLYSHLTKLAKQQSNSQAENPTLIKPAYLYQLQKQLFKQILDDSKLKEMGAIAQTYPINSELRTYALTELVRAIKLSGRLCRPHTSKFSPSLYSVLYEEALAETLAYICLNIELYDPQRGHGKFMNWVNFKLDKSILKAYSRYQKNARHEIYCYADLEQIRQPAQNPDLAEILQEYLRKDPNNIFVTAHIRNRPDANFSTIALAKFSNLSWEQISEQLNIPVATLSSFYNRWCRRFAPLLKTELNKYF